MKVNNCQYRILYLAEMSFKHESEKKMFSVLQKLREFIFSRFTLNEILKDVLQAVEKLSQEEAE